MQAKRLAGFAAALAAVGLSVTVDGFEQPRAIAAPAQDATFEVVHVRNFGGGPVPGHFKEPGGIAVHPDGRVFVSDSGYSRVQVFDARGTFLAMFGARGTAPGQFMRPEGIAFDRSGLVFVVDSGNARIQVFTSDGKFVRAWGSKGTATGQFERPAGIAVDGEGRVFVADTYNYRVQVFTTTGEFIRTWGSKGAGDGQFMNPKFPGGDGPGPFGVAAGGNGLVYVTDPWNARVQVFTPAGEFMRQWSAGNTPAGIAIDSRDVVTVTNAGWAVDLNATGMRKFTSAGVLLRRWYGDGIGPGQFDSASAVAIDGSSNVYLADSGNNRIQKFNAGGAFVTQWGSNGDGLLRGPSGVEVDRDGRVYVVDSRNGRVQRFSPDGAFQATFGQKRRGGVGGNFTHSTGVAINNEGLVYVSDLLDERIHVFSANGEFLRWWTPAARQPRDTIIRGMTLGPANELYRLEDHELIKFDAQGRRLVAYKGARDAFLTDFALDSKGNVYLAEAHEDRTWTRVRVLSPAGKEIAKWPSVGRGDGKHAESLRIAIDSHDRVYLSEWWNCRIEVFDSRGAFLGRWGSCGFGDGEFNNLSGIAVADGGLVYAADYENNRVQVFRTVIR
jgi:sugar lactone lactonase YvrE